MAESLDTLSTLVAELKEVPEDVRAGIEKGLRGYIQLMRQEIHLYREYKAQIDAASFVVCVLDRTVDTKELSCAMEKQFPGRVRFIDIDAATGAINRDSYLIVVRTIECKPLPYGWERVENVAAVPTEQLRKLLRMQPRLNRVMIFDKIIGTPEQTAQIERFGVRLLNTWTPYSDISADEMTRVITQQCALVGRTAYGGSIYKPDIATTAANEDDVESNWVYCNAEADLFQEL